MRTPLTYRPLIPLLFAFLFLPACASKTPQAGALKTPQTQQEWTDATNALIIKCVCDNDDDACKDFRRLRAQYEEAHPCPYTAVPKAWMEEFERHLPSTPNEDFPEADQWIAEAQRNNYGDCRTRSSTATYIRLVKATALYLRKDYQESAQEFKRALSEHGPDNNVPDGPPISFLAFYPSALIKGGDTEQAKEVLQTPLYTPVKAMLKGRQTSLLSFTGIAGSILKIPELENYSLPVLALAAIIKDTPGIRSNPNGIPFIDALQTIAPYTPVPDLGLE
ncbi:hypothetical protein ACR42D_10080 [Desulfovibrio caledoniensis]